MADVVFVNIGKCEPAPGAPKEYSAPLAPVEVLRALYAMGPIGMGDFCEPELAVERARAYVEHSQRTNTPIEYIDHRALFVNFGGDAQALDPTDYDRARGTNAMEERVKLLREMGGRWDQGEVPIEVAPPSRVWRP